MAHAQKPDFVFRRNGRVHLNRRGSSVQSPAGSRGVRIGGSNAGYTTFRGSVIVLATHSIRQFPLHFPSRASPCAIRFQTHSSCIIRSNLVIKRNALKFYKLCVTSYQSDRILSLLREGEGVKCNRMNKTTNWCDYRLCFIYFNPLKD